jgi:galactonate dehydratase
MKITAVDCLCVPPGWLFLHVKTDEGVTGWGELGVKERERTSTAAVGELSEHLIGNDPLRIEDHWQVLSKAGFCRGGPILSSAVAGIDQALWDIAGKVHGVPVHALLGGPVRERMPVYGWVWGEEGSARDIDPDARAQLERGHRRLKMAATSMLPAPRHRRPVWRHGDGSYAEW